MKKHIIFVLVIFLNISFIYSQNKIEIIDSIGCKIQFSFIKLKKESLITNKNKFYYWFDNNKIHSTKDFAFKKILDGKYIKFDKDGFIIEYGSFDNGLKNGEWRFYNKNGNIIKLERWKKGILKNLNDSTNSKKQ